MLRLFKCFETTSTELISLLRCPPPGQRMPLVHPPQYAPVAVSVGAATPFPVSVLISMHTSRQIFPHVRKRSPNMSIRRAAATECTWCVDT